MGASNEARQEDRVSHHEKGMKDMKAGTKKASTAKTTKKK